MNAQVEVWRGAIVESTHRLAIAVADADGGLRALAGPIDTVTFARSAIKPLQALPLVDDGAVEKYGITEAELALCCASHSGEPMHVDAALRLLRRIGLGPDALACGPHEPLDEAAARALRSAGHRPGREHNNCSGKHAGMLALARSHDWPFAGYEKPEHPVQQRMLTEVARWTGDSADAIPKAIDGCGVVTFALSIEAMARAFARLAGAARNGERGPATVFAAMGKHPEYVGGTDRLCTALVRGTEGRILAKVGAEGVYCAAVPGAKLGIALKVLDGATRASQPALIAVLHALGLLSVAERAQLGKWIEPVVQNTRGENVGSIHVAMELETRA